MITSTATSTLMTEDADLLTLTQWLSPVFPVGGYAYSHGLETAIAAEDVTNAVELTEWLRVVLEFGGGQADAVLLTSAMKTDADHAALNDWASALAASSERWQETYEQGSAFVRAANAITGQDYDAMALPVAVGRAAAKLSVPAERVASLYLQALISNLATGAVRHIPLGQAEGQRVIAKLQEVVLAVAKRSVEMAPEDIRGAAFGADMAALKHETQEVRIFRT